jgi:uncharacterized membrane protein
MLLVLDPIAYISCAVAVSVLTKPMRFVVSKEADVNITIGVDKATASISLIVLPISFEYAAVGSNQFSTSTTLFIVFVPLPSILRVIVKGDAAADF